MKNLIQELDELKPIIAKIVWFINFENTRNLLDEKLIQKVDDFMENKTSIKIGNQNYKYEDFLDLVFSSKEEFKYDD